MNTLDVLQKLTDAVGVSGAEHAASQTAASLLSQYTEDVTIDAMGNVLAVIKKGSPNILLDAHIDRIGLIVTEICDGGFLRVAPCGGVDKKVLAAQRVCIHTKGGDLYGVVTAMPPHLQTADEMKKIPDFDQMFIDTGFSKAEAEKRIARGDRVTVCTPAVKLQNDRFCASAVDDRAGVVALLGAVDRLKDCALDCGLTVLLSVQEETGERGAQAMSGALCYDTVIAVDVSFAHTPDAKRHKCGVLGGGAMIGIAPSLDKTLSDTFIEIAKENGYKYQLEVMSGETGTNADALGVGSGGAKAGLLSIPLRYMHTPAEVIDLQDVESVSQILADYVVKVGASDAR